MPTLRSRTSRLEPVRGSRRSRIPLVLRAAAGLLSAALLVSPQASGPVRAQPPAVGGGPFALRSATDARIVFTCVSEPGRVQRLDDGRLHVEDAGGVASPVGSAVSAPRPATWVAMPPGVEGRVRVEFRSVVALPWPEEMSDRERAAVIAGLDPEGWSSEPASWMHDQWGMPIRFCPLVPDGRGGLSYVRDARFTVETFLPSRRGEAGPPQARRAEGRDPFEGVYRTLFLNYEQAKSWRRAEPVHAREGFSLVEDGFSSTPNPWIKVFVPRRGIYGIEGSALAALGLELSSIDPVTLRLFRPEPLPLSETESYAEAPSWMLEVPIELFGMGDGVLDVEDEIRFVGQGGDGFFDELGVDVRGPDRHFRDPYDGAVVYWLTWGGTFAGEPRRIPSVDATEISPPYSNLVSDRAHFEEDRFWEPRPYPTEAVPPGERPAAWERFWWLSLTASRDDPEQVVRLHPPDPVADRPVRVRMRFSATIPFDTSEDWPDHAVRVRLNGTKIVETDRLPDGRPWNHLARQDVDTTGIWLVDGVQELRLLAPYRPLQNPQGVRVDNVLFAWIELDYTRRLVAHGDTIAFLAGGPLRRTVQSLEITGFTTDQVLLYEATDLFSPRRFLPVVAMEEGSRRIRFRAELDDVTPDRFLAATPATLIRPRLALKQVPADGWLRERTGAAQMIVLTHSDLLVGAELLAAARRQGLPGPPGVPDRSPASLAVVTTEEIYDEFSFGRQDPTAIRNFFQFARDRWNGGRPEDGPAYVVLLGDAYYDYRDLQQRGGRNLVPTFEGYWDVQLDDRIYSPQFGSDDYYFLLDPGFALDLYFARLPVRTAVEANAVVRKILLYDDGVDEGPWRGRVTLVADDLCQGTRSDILGSTHMVQTEALVPLLPSVLQVDKVYLYDFGTECAYDRKPLAAQALLDRMNEGTLIVNFTGHGSDEQLADERVLEITSVPGLVNARKPFLFFTASCSVGKYDFFGEGLGEALMLSSTGGAVAVLSASAIAYSGANSDLNQRFFQALFPDTSLADPRPLGEATVIAKNGQGGVLNSRRYVLLGDPATRLVAPRGPVNLSLETGHGGMALGDTLPRGVLTRLRGRVNDSQGQPDPSYEGIASVRIYDSSVVRRVGNGNFSYLLNGAPIYRDSVSVESGEFDLSFVVPSALRTGTRGPARVYVHVAGGPQDAGGSLPKVAVPEVAAPPGDDQEGPGITVRFLGANPGDDGSLVVPARAFFIAELEDTSGINITELVGSRSVVLQIEQAGRLVYLEDLAEQVLFEGDYRRAKLTGQLPRDLAVGIAYDLVLRASDNRSNSAAARVAFSLAGGGPAGFSLSDVFVFPNPSTEGARFYGKTSEPADVEIQLFTLSGRRIWKARVDGLPPVRFEQEGIAWDGRDADGDEPANGVYLYKLTARPVGAGKARSVEGRVVVSR